MRRAATSLTLAASLLLAGPALAEPALWKVTDADSTVWMFGSIHFLDRARPWRTPAFEAALEASDLVFFELILADAAPGMAQVIDELGRSPEGRGFSDYLSADEWDRWLAAAGGMGLDPLAFEAFRPWFVALTLPGPEGVTLDFDAGVEMTLQNELDDGRERSLETLEQQLRALSEMTDRGQVDLLMNALDGADTAAEAVGSLIDAWVEGDIDTVAGLLADQIGTPGTELYDRLIVARNERWAVAVETVLALRSDAMVVVGAGHFAGEHGLPALLAARGLDVERVQ